mmetsp:Transcript_18057/g.41077  ORF Transcript_18057/g.41077 Transcript_18057/m.41077 type:complete len:148 (-) Transcript_18057:593-1036(-)
MRLAQAVQLRRLAEETADALKEKGWDDVTILMLGDFNSEPSDPSVKSILSQKEGEEGSSTWGFQTTYPLETETNLYTTWKTRKGGTVRRTIDYIFHGSEENKGEDDGRGMRCTHFLSVPKDEEVEEGGLPGFRYPSDHLLIAAKFHY